MVNERGLYHAPVKSTVAPEKSANLVLHPNPWENVTDNSVAYMDDVELAWFGEEDVAINCIPQTTLVYGVPIIVLGSFVAPCEDV